MQRAGEKPEIERDAEERESGDQQTGDGAGSERKFKAAGELTDRRLRRAHVGAYRDVHPDETGCSGQDRADSKADADKPTEEIPDDEKNHDADDSNRGVLPAQVGLRAFAHRRSYFLHASAAGSACSTE